VRVGRVGRWLVAVVVVFGLASATSAEGLGDDERPAVRAPVLDRTMDPGWAALDDPAPDRLDGDVETATLPLAAVVALGTSTLGALLTRAAPHGIAGWSGVSPTRGPPRAPLAPINSLPIVPARPSECSIEGRGPPGYRRSACASPALYRSTHRTPLQEERS
jgi:hypothetical protein